MALKRIFLFFVSVLGEVELRVQVTAFHFKEALSSHSSTQPVLDSCTPLDGIVEVLSGDITYTGCGRCSAELDTDANGIYAQCYPCLPHTAVRRYYRYCFISTGNQWINRYFIFKMTTSIYNRIKREIIIMLIMSVFNR